MKILFAIGCWLLWNFAVFNLDKNKDDEAHKQFGYGQYAKEKWEKWVGSLICCGIIFLVMKLGYGVDVLSMTGLDIKWSDALIGASGPGYEVVLWLIGKIKKQLPQ